MIRVLIFLLLLSLGYGQRLHHSITARVNPQDHFISVRDTITFTQNWAHASLSFFLNHELSVSCVSPGVQLKLEKKDVPAQDSGMDMEAPQVAARVKQNKYRLIFKGPINKGQKVVLNYQGTVYFPVRQLAGEYARGFSTTPGIIDTQGVYLAGSSDWVPWFSDSLFTFTLTTLLPPSWDVVSQGKRTFHHTYSHFRKTTWQCDHPMEEIFLIAAPFVEFEKIVGQVHVMAFLRSNDPSLANKYLETTGQYLEMYRKLIGPYPFWKFALVENFWETGYGMPSFTLLGPQIIRFPFILHSSYPHELLHNWWGNSVYVDFDHGNWCEGTTVYMADHLIKEQRGQGEEYRRSTLQRYTDYVNAENDFPLESFLSRYNAPSEAIGYGKSMMMWDMLREMVGDKEFIAAFQRFYRQNRFRKASFDHIRRAFEEQTGKDLASFFKQWVERTGAPTLSLKEVTVSKNPNHSFTLEVQLLQTQTEPAFTLRVPLAVFFKDSAAVRHVIMNRKDQSFRLNFNARPLEVRVDPQYHVFRRLHYYEIPPALSGVFGKATITIVLPSAAGPAIQKRYRMLAEKWAADPEKEIRIVMDNELKELPLEGGIWVMGAQNRWLPVVQAGIKGYPASMSQNSIRLGKQELSHDNHSFVLCVRHPQKPKNVIAFLTIANDSAALGLARKLPHYGKYSYLAFSGSEPANVAKGQWPTIHSPLARVIPLGNGQMPTDYATQLPARQPLARLAPLFSAKRMMQHIHFLAAPQREGRGLGTIGIEEAAQYIAQHFKKYGLLPAGDHGSYYQSWQETVDKQGHKKSVKNIIAMLPGNDPQLSDQAVVVCAHYDHLGYGWPDVHQGDEGKIHPGADDNASGVAVLLELARVLANSYKPQRTILFIAFTAEEAGLKGSQYFIEHYKTFPTDKIMAVLNLDTVGRLFGKKVLILNANSAREWPFIFMGVGWTTGVASEIVTQPLDASDQVSFIRAGIPAVQIFSGPHADYHRPTDTVDKIDAKGLEQIATLTKEALVYLAERKEALTFKGKTQPTAASQKAKKQRKVSTGTVPDFSYRGQGVKIQSVIPGSAAQKAGLMAGDVIIAVNGEMVRNLRDYSNILKRFAPGETIQLKIKRGAKLLETTLTLNAR